MERSPTAEMVFKDVPGWNVKSAGTSINAIIPVSRELIDWADKIIVMENRHMEKLIELSPSSSSKIHVLGIDDIYYRCSPELIGLLITKISAQFPLDTWIKTKFKCHSSRMYQLFKS
jgi:predicted protein tyrosine phosphatase